MYCSYSNLRQTLFFNQKNKNFCFKFTYTQENLKERKKLWIFAKYIVNPNFIYSPDFKKLVFGTPWHLFLYIIRNYNLQISSLFSDGASLWDCSKIVPSPVLEKILLNWKNLEIDIHASKIHLLWIFLICRTVILLLEIVKVQCIIMWVNSCFKRIMHPLNSWSWKVISPCIQLQDTLFSVCPILEKKFAS